VTAIHLSWRCDRIGSCMKIKLSPLSGSNAWRRRSCCDLSEVSRQCLSEWCVFPGKAEAFYLAPFSLYYAALTFSHAVPRAKVLIRCTLLCTCYQSIKPSVFASVCRASSPTNEALGAPSAEHFTGPVPGHAFGFEQSKNALLQASYMIQIHPQVR
jgi:hypothetical protein